MARKEIKYVQIANYYPKLKNPKKYTGTLPLTLRSSYEIKFVKKFLDNNDKILEWSCESVIIPYYYSIDRKMHRYFVDFWFKVEESEGVFKEYLVEIKPANKCAPPKKQKRNTKTYQKRVAEYIKNQEKWDSARKFCKQLKESKGTDIEFKVITEKELGIKK